VIRLQVNASSCVILACPESKLDWIPAFAGMTERGAI